jgi:hypothetical protein
MNTNTKLLLLILALLSSLPVLAIEVTEFEGGAHAFPALLDLAGKKLADGDFSQWIEDDRLHIRIIYKFGHRQRIEENAVFRQKPELIQDEWSWRELREGQLYREFAVDFRSQTATAQKRDKDDLKHWSEKIDIQVGRAYAGFGFALALQNLRKRLIDGERIELQAIGFNPKPQVVAVELSHGGVDEMKMSDRSLEGDRFIIHPKLPAIAKLLVKVPDTQIWLTKPPASFLRWEGPMAEPNDPIIRVDLVPGAESGPAKPVETNEEQQKHSPEQLGQITHGRSLHVAQVIKSQGK